MQGGSSSNKECPSHPQFQIGFVCVEKKCLQPLCQRCISQHCQDHKSQKTFPNIKTIDEIRDELSSQTNEILSFLYGELEKLHLTSQERVYQNLASTQNKVIETVNNFFKEKESILEDKLKDLSNGTVNDAGNSQIKDILSQKVDEYEKVINDLSKEDNNEQLISFYQKDFKKEAKNVKEEIQSQIEPIKINLLEQYQEKIHKALAQSILLTKFNIQNFFLNNSEWRHSEIEISGEDFPYSVKKVGSSSQVSICLGDPITAGTHTMVIKIEDCSSGGWVGLGFINKNEINFAQSNYGQAICICSDQSYYNLQMNNGGKIGDGITYTFIADFEAGEVTITSTEGMLAKSSNYQKGITLYPYLEFRGQHHISILSYEKQDL